MCSDENSDAFNRKVSVKFVSINSPVPTRYNFMDRTNVETKLSGVQKSPQFHVVRRDAAINHDAMDRVSDVLDKIQRTRGASL